jgi:hypothetical protein
MREYGLLLKHENRSGMEYVTVTVSAREPDKDYPLGCRSDGENEFDSNVPKHMHGMMIDGLGMHGFVSEYDFAFIGHEVEFRDVYSIDIPKANRMIKTLRRVVKVMTKDGAHDPGDRFMALARSLKLSFAVVRVGEARPFNEPAQWRWMTIAEGRNRYRALIDDAVAAMKKRKGVAA